MQETRRPKKTQLSWEKKYCIKGKMDSLWTLRNITSLDGSRYEAIDSSISQNIFSYLKMFSMQCRKNTTVEDNKKRMNIANFLNIYTNIYTYITCDENDSKWKWFNKLNTAAWSCCWQKWLCSISYFRISIFDPLSQTVQMEGSYHLLS